MAAAKLWCVSAPLMLAAATAFAQTPAPQAAPLASPSAPVPEAPPPDDFTGGIGKVGGLAPSGDKPAPTATPATATVQSVDPGTGATVVSGVPVASGATVVSGAASPANDAPIPPPPESAVMQVPAVAPVQNVSLPERVPPLPQMAPSPPGESVAVDPQLYTGLTQQLGDPATAPLALLKAFVHDPVTRTIGGETMHMHVYRFQAVNPGAATLTYYITTRARHNAPDAGSVIENNKTVLYFFVGAAPAAKDPAIIYLSPGETYDLALRKGGGTEIDAHDYSWGAP